MRRKKKELSRKEELQVAITACQKGIRAAEDKIESNLEFIKLAQAELKEIDEEIGEELTPVREGEMPF